MARKLKRPASRGSVNNVILEILSAGEKYGYEIIKEVEEKTNGEVKLKQPSLYSSLSRFEAKGYVTSYWKDSDIGGKRHYYELTPLGIQVCKTMLSKNKSNDEEINSKLNADDSNIPSSFSYQNQFDKDVENNDNNAIFEIDTNSDDTVDIFNNDTTIKLQHYANFDMSEKLNELLNEDTNIKNDSAKTDLDNDISDIIIEESCNNEQVHNELTNSITQEEAIVNNYYNNNSNKLVHQNNCKQKNDAIEILASPITNNNVLSSLSNDNITEQINQLDEQIISVKNAEVENNINKVNNENNLKNIYNEIKYKEQKNVEPIKHTPLTHLEQLKRMESMEILYGNPTNYYFPDETQETISQNEEQIDFETFVKLKSELNNKRFLYNKSKAFRKKDKPYIFQTIFHANKNTTNKNFNSSQQTKENKVKFKFDEFGIMKIIDDNNYSETKIENQTRVVDNVGYRINKATLNPQVLQSSKYQPSPQNNNLSQLSSVEIERRNQNFTEKFDKISKEKFNLYNTNETNQNHNQSQTESIKIDNEINHTDQYSNTVPNKNNELEDVFIDFENSDSIQDLYNTQNDTQIESESLIQHNTLPNNSSNFINDFNIDDNDNTAIKQYGKIDTFNNEINSNYVSVNKVKCVFGIIFTLLLVTELTITLLLLKKNNLIFNYDSILYIISYVVATIIGVFFLIPFILNINKKIENTFKLSYSMSFSSLSFIIICVLTYSINTLFGFSFKNGIEYLSRMIIPILFGFNILIAPCIYFVILKIRKFYK